MSIVQIPRSEGRISGFPIPANRFDGVNLGLAVAISDKISDLSATVGALRRAANAQGTPIVGQRVMSNGDHLFAMKMPADPGQLFIQIGVRVDDVRTKRNTFDLRDRGEIIARFESLARHYDEAGDGIFAPKDLTWNVRGRVVTERMFGRTIETPDGPLADFGRHADGRRNDYGSRASIFGRANNDADWSVIARSVVARIDRDKIERINQRELRALYDAARDGNTSPISPNEFRELIEAEMVGAIAGRNAQGRTTAQRLSTALPEHDERGGTRLVLAQFSTPPAISQVAAEFLKPNGKVIFEPTIGNGVLAASVAQYGGLIAGVELDASRAARAEAALNRGDAVASIRVGDAFAPSTYPDNPADPSGFDGAIINPPYRKLSSGEDDPLDGKVTLASLGGASARVRSAEALIAAQAIDRIKPGGAALLVMPGNMMDPSSIEPKQRLFHNILNTAFEKVDAVALDAHLYRSMGANFPVIVYFCEGKRSPDRVPSPGELPDMLPDSYPVLNSFGELYQAADRIISASNIAPLSDAIAEQNRVAFAGLRLAAPSTPTLTASSPTATAEPAPIAPDAPAIGRRGEGVSSPKPPPSFVTTPPVVIPPVAAEPPVDAPEPSQVLAPAAPEQDAELSLPGSYHLLDNFDDDPLTVAYTPFSAKPAGNVVIERAFEGSTYSALRHVVSAKGDIDRYVASKLGFEVEHLLSDDGPLSGTQIDALALSFFNREEKRATIVGDLMGVGKGRTMAAHAYSSFIEGRSVLMMSNKPHLFRDLAVRDLKNVSGNSLRELLDWGVVRPFIMNSNAEAALTEKDGNTVIFQTVAAERNKVRDNGIVDPKDYNLIMSSYSQFQTAAGVWKADAIERWIVECAAANPDKPPVLILDEIHEAAGPDSRTGVVMRRMLDTAERVGAEIVFSSATSMKSGKNIGIYKQALPDTGLSIDQLTAVIENNPFAMQEVLSTEMARSGSLIQRKLSGAGVRRDMRLLADVDPDKLDEARVMTDILAEFLREAVSMAPEIKAAASQQAKMRFGGGISAASIDNKFKVDTVSPAASFDAISRYYLISMKSRYSLDLLREVTAAGEKATVLQEFTGDSVAEYVLAADGYKGGALPPEGVQVSQHPNIGHVVKRMAERMLDVKGTDALGNALSFRIAGFDSWLSDFLERVDDADFSKWRVNSFDAMREACEDLGMTFEDISGRKFEFVTENEKLICRPRDIPSKMAVANRYNNGQTDVVMLTSAAATGLSLHNSPEEGVDLRTRAMIFLSFLKNVASHTQAEGRIDRTGQLSPPHYIIPNTGFVADDRLASLFNRGNRNLSSMTSGSRENDRTVEEAIDLLNPVGDMAVRHVLRQNPELAETLGIPVTKEGEIEVGDLGRKLLGRAFILGAEGSQDVLADVDMMSKTILQDLEAAGENPLKLGRYDWRADIEVVEVLHDGDPDSIALADQPLNLVEIKRQEPRKVLAAPGIIDRMVATAAKRDHAFETPEEALSVSKVFTRPGMKPNSPDAWNFGHRLFDRLTARAMGDDGGLGNDVAFESEAPAALFTQIHREYLNQSSRHLAAAGRDSGDFLTTDDHKAIVDLTAQELRRDYQVLDEHQKVDTEKFANGFRWASDDDKTIAKFLNTSTDKGKLRRDVDNLERAVRLTMQRTSHVAAFMDFADHIEPGRLIAVNVNAVDALVGGRFVELTRQAELSPSLARWMPAVIVDAHIDYQKPTTLSRSDIKIFVPGETGVFTMTLSEMRSNLLFRGDTEKPLAPFSKFAAQANAMRYDNDAAPVVREYVGEANADRFYQLMNDYRIKNAYATAAQEADASRVVDGSGQQRDGATVFRELADMLPRGSITRKRYGLTGNLFTAMSAVTGTTARDKNLGEKAVVTDKAGNNVNVILLTEAGQKQAVEKVKQKEKSRSHPRPELRGNEAMIRAELDLTGLILRQGRNNLYRRNELREISFDDTAKLVEVLGTMYPKSYGTPEGLKYVERNAGEIVGGILNRLKSDQTYPASLLIGGDLWRELAEEQGRRVRETKGKMVFEAPANYSVGRLGGAAMPYVSASFSNLALVKGLSDLSDNQVVALHDGERMHLLFRKNHALAQSGDFAELVERASDRISIAGDTSIKMSRGVLSVQARYENTQGMGKLTEFMTRASALSESAPLAGGFARNIHTAVAQEHAEFVKAMRREKERAAGVSVEINTRQQSEGIRAPLPDRPHPDSTVSSGPTR